MVIIEEINDDGKNYEQEGSGAVFYGPSMADKDDEYGFAAAFSGGNIYEQSFHSQGLLPTGLVNEAHPIPFSRSNPGWNRIVESDMSLSKDLS
jgi:hypothetical protein